MNAQQLRDLDSGKLQEKLAEFRQELMNLRFQHANAVSTAPAVSAEGDWKTPRPIVGSSSNSAGASSIGTYLSSRAKNLYYKCSRI